MDIINFRTTDHGTISSEKRHACYTAKADGKKLRVTGRTPEKDIFKGTILQEIPFLNIVGLEYRVKEVSFRPHKNILSWFWEAECERHETSQ